MLLGFVSRERCIFHVGPKHNGGAGGAGGSLEAIFHAGLRSIGQVHPGNPVISNLKASDRIGIDPRERATLNVVSFNENIAISRIIGRLPAVGPSADDDCPGGIAGGKQKIAADPNIPKPIVGDPKRFNPSRFTPILNFAANLDCRAPDSFNPVALDNTPVAHQPQGAGTVIVKIVVPDGIIGAIYIRHVQPLAWNRLGQRLGGNHPVNRIR